MKSLIRLLQGPALPGLFGSAAPRAAHSALLRAQMDELPVLPPDDADQGVPACGWFDSSHELQSGLEVMEHTHPAAVAAALPLSTWLDWELCGLHAAQAQASWAPCTPAPDARHACPTRHRRFRHRLVAGARQRADGQPAAAGRASG